MDKITLRNGNVVKEVESDDRAKALEAKGFVRDGAAPAITAEDTKALEKELQKAREELTRACGSKLCNRIYLWCAGRIFCQ